MSATITYIKETYNELFDKHSDPVTRDWPMVRSPFPTITLVILYLLFVKVIGPRIMKNRKPLQLKTAMIMYNGLQTLLCFYLATTGYYYGWRRYSLACQPITDHPHEDVMRRLSWLFYMIRFLEFTDTIFFILRKKFNQVSTLHVVHHAIVPFMFWVGVLTTPAGHYTLPAYMNTIVHTFMYSYYLFSALGPKYQKWLFWKKYMTKMQLVQFVLALAHAIYTLSTDCDVPKWVAYIVVAQGILFFGMFLNFYIESYNKEKEKKSKEAQKKIQNGNKVNAENEIHNGASTSGVSRRKTRIE